MPNDNFNHVVDFVKYHVNTLSQFQDILDKIGEKVKFGGWLRISTNMG